MPYAPLLTNLTQFFELLCQTEPVTDNTDVAWVGPYYIPTTRRWGETYFSIYQHRLYASLAFGSERYFLTWNIRSNTIDLEQDRFSHGYYNNDEILWQKLLAQITPRLRAALKNPSRYNRMVEARMPPKWRTGKIQRALTWAISEKRGVPLKRLIQLERIVKEALVRPDLKTMSASNYFNTAGIAYDAVFKDLRPLTARKKYMARADGRHGGLLDLPPKNAVKFAQWFTSRKWAGTHPFEIVFGHPHGIMLYPRFENSTRRWRYSFSVSSLGWYDTAVKMALALGAAGVVFDFDNHEDVLAALRGVDQVDVGAGSRSVYYEELAAERPDALAHIIWDPLPLITPISDAQRIRVIGAVTDTTVKEFA
jgi:hypothetical protein